MIKLKNKKLRDRLLYLMAVCQSAGEALLILRDANLPFEYQGSQLKSAADAASDRWIKSLLRRKYPREPIISEESEKSDFGALSKGGVWIVDPLDGTKSYHGGFDGFCVQAAFMEKGKIKIAVVYWPVKKITYWAAAGYGAFRRAGKRDKRLPILKHKKPYVYIDNRPAPKLVARILRESGATKFLECGSFGLKICRVAEGSADIFLKDEEYKIWDTAPAQLILSEAGGLLTDWKGKEISYRTVRTKRGLLAARRLNHTRFIKKIKGALK